MQEIPIINYSAKDWPIKVNLVNNNTKAANFTGPPQQIIIPKKYSVQFSSTGYYPLTYVPINYFESHATLTFENHYTFDLFKYELKGIVKEPLAQEHIIIKCQVGQKVKKSIEIANATFKQVSYMVETDIEPLSGPAQFDVQPYSKNTYVFEVNPKIGGVYTGQITFFDAADSNKYTFFI